MSPKDRIDALMKLADFRLTRWKTRADAEWKISLAFWGFLLAATSLKNKPPQGFGWWLAAIVLAYIVLWVFQIWRRNERDHREAFRYADAAEEILMGRPPLPFRTGLPWALVFQAVTGIMFGLYAWWAVSVR